MIKYNKYSESVLDTMIKERTRKANDRIKGLERGSSKELSKEAYKNANAYRWLERNVDKEQGIRRTKEGGIRFSSKTKGLSKKEKIEQLETIQKFLESKTSTVRGTEKAYRGAYNSFIKGSDTNISYEDYIRMMESSTLESFKANLYSQFARLMKGVKSGTITPEQSRLIMEQYANSDIKTINEAIHSYENINEIEEGFIDADVDIMDYFGDGK